MARDVPRGRVRQAVDTSADLGWHRDRLAAYAELGVRRCLIGALMWLTAEQARPILELVPDTAIWRPMTQWAYEMIRAVVADGRVPNPVLVLSTAGQASPKPGHPPRPGINSWRNDSRAAGPEPDDNGNSNDA